MAEKIREFKLVGVGSASSQEKIEKPALSFMQDAWRRLKKNKLAVISMWFLGILLVFSMISVVLVPRDDANAFNTKEVTTRILFMALNYDLWRQNYFNNSERNTTFVPIYLYNLMIYRLWSR